MKDERSYLKFLAGELAIVIGLIYPMKDERSYMQFLATVICKLLPSGKLNIRLVII